MLPFLDTDSFRQGFIASSERTEPRSCRTPYGTEYSLLAAEASTRRDEGLIIFNILNGLREGPNVVGSSRSRFSSRSQLRVSPQTYSLCQGLQLSICKALNSCSSTTAVASPCSFQKWKSSVGIQTSTHSHANERSNANATLIRKSRDNRSGITRVNSKCANSSRKPTNNGVKDIFPARLWKCDGIAPTHFETLRASRCTNAQRTGDLRDALV